MWKRACGVRDVSEMMLQECNVINVIMCFIIILLKRYNDVNEARMLGILEALQGKTALRVAENGRIRA